MPPALCAAHSVVIRRKDARCNRAAIGSALQQGHVIVIKVVCAASITAADLSARITRCIRPAYKGGRRREVRTARRRVALYRAPYGTRIIASYDDAPAIK